MPIVDEVAGMLSEARRRRDWAAIFELVPYARFLGMSPVELDGGWAGKMQYDDKLIGNPRLPALHGGTLGALLELTAVLQVLSSVDEDIWPKTINLTVEYLRPGRPIDTFAQGVVTRQGRRVANVRVEAWQEDRARLIATANVHLLLGSLQKKRG